MFCLKSLCSIVGHPLMRIVQNRHDHASCGDDREQAEQDDTEESFQGCFMITDGEEAQSVVVFCYRAY